MGTIIVSPEMSLHFSLCFEKIEKKRIRKNLGMARISQYFSGKWELGTLIAKFYRENGKRELMIENGYQ